MDYLDKTTTIDGEYRYTLMRRWEPLGCPKVLFLLLNPSTADGLTDDPTVRKCVSYAKRWGCGHMMILNLFGLRATDPETMKAHPDPMGANNFYLLRYIEGIDLVVAAWGNHGSHLCQSTFVKSLAKQMHRSLHYLHMNKTSEPAHPLYLPGNLTPTLWSY